MDGVLMVRPDRVNGVDVILLRDSRVTSSLPNFLERCRQVINQNQSFKTYPQKPMSDITDRRVVGNVALI